MMVTSSRCEKSSLVAHYVSGELSDSASEAFELHLEDCQECLCSLSSALQASTNSAWDKLIAPLTDESLQGSAHRETGLAPIITPVKSSGHQSRLDTEASSGALNSLGIHPVAKPGTPDGHPGVAEQGSSLSEHFRYRKIRLAGTGGMGVVWEAWDEKMQRSVAIKSLRNLAADFHATERLVQEAAVLARLSHPNIVTVYELTESDGRPALVLEYVNGLTLADHLRGQPVAEADAVSVLIRITKAVGHAHRLGVIHRDLKPSNILIRLPVADDGTPIRLQDADVKVSDFGLARVLDERTLTHAGQILGTPCYMAPEQIAGDTALIGPGVDIYGLGTILYELVTGRPPFVSDDPAVTMSMIREHDPISPRILSVRLSRDLELVCLKCLAKSPRDRYENAELLLEDLQAVVEGRPVRAQPIRAWRRLSRWVRRNQKLAAMGFFSVLMIVAVIALSLLSAASEKSLREKASEAEALAVSNAARAQQHAEIAKQAAAEAQQSSAQLTTQLQATMSSMRRLLNITQAPDSFVRSMASESQMQFFREALRAHREYLEIAGMNKPLSPDDIDTALTYVWLMETVEPEQSMQKELSRIQDSLSRLQPENYDPKPLLRLEIRLCELKAREFAHRGNLADAGETYLVMADLIRQDAESNPLTDPEYGGRLRISAEMLMNAAASYAQAGDHQACLDAIGKACAVYERLLQMNPASDRDAIQLTVCRYAAVWENHLKQDDAAALKAAEAAETFCSQYKVQKPELAAEFEQARQRHWTFIQSEKQRLGK